MEMKALSYILYDWSVHKIQTPPIYPFVTGNLFYYSNRYVVAGIQDQLVSDFNPELKLRPMRTFSFGYILCFSRGFRFG